jgi:UDP-N-acetylglucosamine:LPS N-acetylglucosamine transferase
VPAVLVVAGGEGMGPVEKTCSAIAKASGASVQLVVVTGRNAKLAERLKLRQWPPGMHVAVQVKTVVVHSQRLAHLAVQVQGPVLHLPSPG